MAKELVESLQQDDDEEVPLLPPSRGLSSAEADRLLDHHGRNELPHKTVPGWLIFMRCMWGPMPIAIWLAVSIEFCLQNFPDGGILLFIQFANATIGWYETTKAGDAVAALRDSLKPLATVMRDGTWQNIDAALLVPGDLVKLASGSAVPADCTINEGTIDVDEAALTGESLPVTMGVEQMPKMGSTVVRGEVDGTVQFTGQKTFFGKTALLLQSVEADLGNIHYVLVRVMFALTSFSFVLCVTCFGYLMGQYKMNFRDSLEFTVVLLVVSIPIAIEIVVTTTLALGSRELAKKKVIVTRLSSIEMMAAVNMLCSDKTGTLTLNKMEIQQQCHVFSREYNREIVLVLAALAAKWREPPRDALDTMVLGVADLDECDKYTQLEFVPFDPRIKRTEATLRGPDGLVFKVTKGAPNVVLQLVHNRDAIKAQVEGIIEDLGRRGVRCLTVARTKEDQQWHMAGILTFLDPPRPDTKETVSRSKEYGVDVKMITGDHQLIAKEMARMLDMDTNILTAEGLPRFPASGDPKDIPSTLGETHGDMMLACGGFAQVYPEHKYLIVETLRQRGYTVAMTGDGVNDSPALKRSDVGVAVDGSTDAARAAADMVLTEPGLSVVVDAMLIARGVFQRMLSFLTYRIAATLQLVLFFFIGVFALPCQDYGIEDPDFRFFRIPVLLFMLITLLNDGTLMTIGYDNVVPDQRPQRWNLPVVFIIATVLASVACASSLLLLWMALDSHDTSSWFHKLGIPPVSEGQIVTMLYLKVSISDFLTLFSSRTGANWFWSFRPSLVLLLGAVVSLGISSCVASFWPDGKLDNVVVVGLSHGNSKAHRLLPLWVWVWCVSWWFVQEIVKVLTYKALEVFDIFNYRTIAEGRWKPSAKTRFRRRSRGMSLGATDNVEQPLLT
ncbi:P-ATPase family transporter: proton [Trypanosoma conorhini]|uniref:Plasma membrane ATPase n=1 Tax=Trypanosoma conorhini TaxID=83891 RepID=A0A3R7LDM9_9TRYP|nr:P-ATPase family transporter: proton [Trypanosoma conorhini]RNF26295.1 P-ATPase family transporter: proton [Trypanosoma conorhini]